MDPPEVGPRRSPGLSGPEVHGLVHPVIPSGRPCALFPALPPVKVLRPQLYTTTSWEALSGYASWVGSWGPSSWDGYPDLGVASYLGWGPRPGGRAFLVGVFLCGVVWGGVR